MDVDEDPGLIAPKIQRATMILFATPEATLHCEGSAKKLPFSFGRDICGIFTKRGCNGSLCHGGVKGKNGFKLSLGGGHVDQPHDMMVVNPRTKVQVIPAFLDETGGAGGKARNAPEGRRNQ